MKKIDPVSLWQEEGDYELMQMFFQKADSNDEQKERIKQRVLEKLGGLPAPVFLDEMDEERIAPSRPRLAGIINATSLLRSAWWRWKWKLLIPVAILGLIWVGQETLTHKMPANLLTSHQNMTTASGARSPQVYGQQGAAGAADSVSGGAPVPNAAAKGYNTPQVAASAPEVQFSSEAASHGSLGSSGSTPQASIAPSPPVQSNVPPADAGVARKLIQRLNVTLQVTKVDLAVEDISRQVKQFGGYIVESQVNGSDSNSSGSMSIKIPAAQFDDFRNKLPGLGKVLNQHLSTDDVTDQYYDTQTRLRNWEAEENRYLDILAQAKTVDDILKVENSLANIRMQIDQLKGQLKLMDNQVDYSEIYLQLVPPDKPYIKITNPWQPVAFNATWKSIQDAFLKTISGTWNVLNYGLIGLGYLAPYLIPALGVALVYRFRRKRKNKE